MNVPPSMFPAIIQIITSLVTIGIFFGMLSSKQEHNESNTNMFKETLHNEISQVSETVKGNEKRFESSINRLEKMIGEREKHSADDIVRLERKMDIHNNMLSRLYAVEGAVEANTKRLDRLDRLQERNLKS